MKCTKRICLLSSPSQCPRFMGPVAVNIRGYSQQKSHLRRLHVATFFSYTIAIKSRPYRSYIGTESRLSLHKVTMRKAPQLQCLNNSQRERARPQQLLIFTETIQGVQCSSTSTKRYPGKATAITIRHINIMELTTTAGVNYFH